MIIYESLIVDLDGFHTPSQSDSGYLGNLSVLTNDATRILISGCGVIQLCIQYYTPQWPWHPRNCSHPDVSYVGEGCPAEMERVWSNFLFALNSTCSPVAALNPFALYRTELCDGRRSYSTVLLSRMRQGIWDRVPALFNLVRVRVFMMMITRSSTVSCRKNMNLRLIGPLWRIAWCDSSILYPLIHFVVLSTLVACSAPKLAESFRSIPN